MRDPIWIVATVGVSGGESVGPFVPLGAPNSATSVCLGDDFDVIPKDLILLTER